MKDMDIKEFAEVLGNQINKSRRVFGIPTLTQEEFVSSNMERLFRLTKNVQIHTEETSEKGVMVIIRFKTVVPLAAEPGEFYVAEVDSPESLFDDDHVTPDNLAGMLVDAFIRDIVDMYVLGEITKEFYDLAHDLSPAYSERVLRDFTRRENAK